MLSGREEMLSRSGGINTTQGVSNRNQALWRSCPPPKKRDRVGQLSGKGKQCLKLSSQQGSTFFFLFIPLKSTDINIDIVIGIDEDLISPFASALQWSKPKELSSPCTGCCENQEFILCLLVCACTVSQIMGENFRSDTTVNC